MRSRRHHHRRSSGRRSVRQSRSQRKNMRLLKRCGVLAAIFVVGAGIGFGVEKLFPPEIEYADERLTVYDAVDAEPSICVDGQWYAERDIESLLVIGIDDLGEIAGADSYNNGSQADFLALLIRDRDTNETASIHLNRDTMTDVPILGVTGEHAGSRHEQLALAYYYGQGEEDSCENTAQAVSNLLYGINVEHYIAVTMDAVPILNDWAGGVRLEVLEDMTSVNPDLVKGREALLWGEDALDYVQARSSLEDSSNLNRMERQRQYASAWFDKAEPLFHDYQEMAELMQDLEGYYYSDCSLEQLKDLAENFSERPPETVYELEGEAAVQSVYMEYHVDEEALQELVLKLFYKPVEGWISEE